jgi:hypothetical protein
VSETVNTILKLRELEDDWDLDGARPIDPMAIELAARFVRSIGELAKQEGLSWQTPSVGPVSDGSVALTWDVGARQTLEIFRPQQLPLVVCVTREKVETGGRPVRQVVQSEEGARLVLWALGSRG